MHRVPCHLRASPRVASCVTCEGAISRSRQSLEVRNSRKIGVPSRSAFSSSPSSAPSFHIPAPTLLFTTSRSATHALRPQRPFHLGNSRIPPSARRGFATRKENDNPFVQDAAEAGSGASSRRRVEVNLSGSTDQVALGYLKKYGRKLAVDWPIQGLKYGALAALAVGGAGYMAASAVAQKARSLFGGRELASYDPAAAAAKKKEGGFFSRMLQNHLQETLAHEVSRTMSLMVAINQEPRLRQEMGGDMTVDMEKAIDRGEYLNVKEAGKHPRFEISTVRTWEYDEHWIISATAYLDEKEDLEREAKEKSDRKKRAKERRKQRLPEEPPAQQDENKKAEKAFDWHFAHMSVFFDNDQRQLILTHDDEAGKDILLLPDAEWPGDAPGMSADVADAWADEDEEDSPQKKRTHKTSQFIDAEVVQPTSSKANKKRR